MVKSGVVGVLGFGLGVADFICQLSIMPLHYWKKVLRHRLNRALGTGFSNRYPETETKGS